MKQKFLRTLFTLNKQFFMDLVVEDLMGQVPLKVSQPVVTILAEQMSKFTKWYVWQAFVLQKRMVNNPKEANIIMGMLLQIKVNMHMLAGGDVTEELAPDTSPAEKARADRIARETADAAKLTENIEAAQRFGKREKPAAPAADTTKT